MLIWRSSSCWRNTNKWDNQSSIISYLRSNIISSSGSEAEIRAMELGGNHKVNSIFEAKWTTTSATKPGPNTGRDTRDRFIRIKYVKRRYFHSRAYYFNAEQERDDEDQQQRDLDTSSIRSPDKELSVTSNHMMLGKYRRKEVAKILNQEVASAHQQRQQYALNTTGSTLRDYDSHHAGMVNPLSRRDEPSLNRTMAGTRADPKNNTIWRSYSVGLNKARAPGDRNDGTGSLNKLFRNFRAEHNNNPAEPSSKPHRGKPSSSTGNNSDDDSVNHHFERYRTTAHSPSPPLPTFQSLPWPPWLPG
jgi:hypothetical protein